ncbi:MAG: S-layer homology domain-containing protein [Oscillospiraceae bacterium]|nr:S-layer homology domain-containing protein [Oscillospiraceae bacterium]
MKKRTLSFLLALVMCLSLLPMTALAAEDMEDVIYTDNRGNQITIPGGAKSCATKVVDFTAGYPWTSDERAMNPEDILGAPDYNASTDENYLCLGAYGSITLEFDIFITDGEGIDIYVFEIGGHVEATKVEVSTDLVTWIEVGTAEGSLCGVDMNGKVPADGKYKYVRITDIEGQSSSWPGADIDAVAGLNAKVPASGSEWANEELEKADAMGLIPDCLDGADLTADITRAEFAAVAVKVYEALAQTAAVPAAENPFTDTTDAEVLKAYNVGITDGVAADKFAPDTLLNREQAATMLTRVYKKVTMEGWTLATDGDFTLSYTMPEPFADDDKISGWAKDSVYFMKSQSILDGVGDNKFAPRATTSAEEAIGYAQATREQALLIAVRMVENLG